MRVSTIITILAVFFILGLCLGYFSFTVFPDLLLPTSTTEYRLLATSEQEVLLVHLLFTFFTGLAFLSVPFSALVAHKSFNIPNLPLLLVIYGIFMSLVTYAAILFYQHSFLELLDPTLISNNAGLPLSVIPYYKLPLFSASVTSSASFVFLLFKKRAVN